MKRWLIVVLTCTIAAGGSAIAAPRALASWIPLSTFGSIAYDDTNHHVFVTGGSGTTDIFVLDDSTKVVATLSSTAGSGPYGLVISPDGSTLLVALADSAAIARFSTATLLEQDPIVLPDPVAQPKKLAFAGGLLWTSFCGGGGGLASVSLTDDSVVAYQGSDFPGCVRVRGGGPGAADLLFAWAPYGEPGGASEFAITAGVPTLVKSAGVAGEGRLPDIAVSNDGKTLYSAQAAPGCVGEYAVADLSTTGGTYTTGDHTTAVAVDTNGRIFAGTNGGGLDMFMPGDADAAWSASPDAGGVWDQGIAVNEWAVAFSWPKVSSSVTSRSRLLIRIGPRRRCGSLRVPHGSATGLERRSWCTRPSTGRHPLGASSCSSERAGAIGRSSHLGGWTTAATSRSRCDRP